MSDNLIQKRSSRKGGLSDVSRPLLPFSVDKASRTNLPRQVTDGLRAAIRTGFFRPGDVLPPVQDIRRFLGVSVRAPLAAIKALSDEGLVASRRHVGCVVLKCDEMSWKGHVLIIYPNVTPVYCKTVIEMTVSDILLRAGYLTTRLMMGGGEVSGYDFSQLALVLKQPISFVLVLGDRPRIFEFLADAGVPYVGMTHARRRTPGAAGVIHYARHAADGELAGYCRSRGVSILEQVGEEGSADFMDSAVFRKVGVKLVTHRIVRRGGVGASALVRTAYDTFADWRPGRKDRALFFIDDYIARGAFAAMLERGIRPGVDVFAGSLSNVGIDLVYGGDVTRLEFNPFAHADSIARAIITWLESGEFLRGIATAPVFIPGDTL